MMNDVQVYDEDELPEEVRQMFANMPREPLDMAKIKQAREECKRGLCYDARELLAALQENREPRMEKELHPDRYPVVPVEPPEQLQA